MKRRTKTVGKTRKSARQKAETPKRRPTPPKAQRGRGSATTSQGAKIARLTREHDEGLEQQSAATRVLQLISSSPDDLQAVFATILENAVRICDASFGDIHRWQGEGLCGKAF